LSQNPAILAGELPLSPAALRRAYPMRALRYWFVHHLLCHEFRRLGRPLSICEVGIDTGQMLQFLQAANAMPADSAAAQQRQVEWSSWTGVDCHVPRDRVAGLGYTRLLEENVEQSDSWMGDDYDATVLLHVLEHLYAPEALFERLVPRMKPGSILLGGFPSVPDWCAKLREPHIRADPNANGHVSAFSPRRVRRLAQTHGLEVEFLSGAYLLRWSGFFLENYAWWLRMNVAFGALFPSWPGEIYWVLRKPAAATAS
jgi:SAM-dependent methyltransferase